MAIVTAIPPNLITNLPKVFFQGAKIHNPRTNKFERNNLGIIDGKIEYIGNERPAFFIEGNVKVVDDCYISSGWIDLHTHYFGCWGEDMDPNLHGLLKGATLQVDAGSAGMKTIQDFIEGVVKKTDGRLIIMENIASEGLAKRTGENKLLTCHNAIETAEKAIQYKDFVKMIKIRIGKTQSTDGSWKKALLMAKEAARLAGGLPVMVHIEDGVHLKQIMEMLGEGDIITHAFRRDGNCSILDSNYRLKPYVKDFLKRGGRLDVGHGAGGFHKENAEAAIAIFMELLANEHYKLYSTSTDLHCFSLDKLAKSLPDVMSKMVSLGATREDIVSSVTKVPAESLGLPASRWRMHKGDPANLTIWDHEESEHKVHTFRDPHKTVWKGREMFKPKMVYVNGQLIEIPEN